MTEIVPTTELEFPEGHSIGRRKPSPGEIPTIWYYFGERCEFIGPELSPERRVSALHIRKQDGMYVRVPSDECSEYPGIGYDSAI